MSGANLAKMFGISNIIRVLSMKRGLVAWSIGVSVDNEGDTLL